MKTVKEFLDTKGYQVWSIAPDASAYDAVKKMADRDVGALLVVESGRLVGIVSERDFVRKAVLHGRSPKEIAVREIMSTDVNTVTPNQTIDQATAIMVEKNIRHLPVVEGDRPIGMISVRDVVKEYIEEQAFLLKTCERNVEGKSYDL